MAGVAALMGIKLHSIEPGTYARKIEESFAAGDFAPTLSKGPDSWNNRAHGIDARTE